MKLIDMHCDTVSELYKKEKTETLAKNSLCVDLEKLEKAGSRIQFFACFVNAGRYRQERWEKAYREVFSMINWIRTQENKKFRCISSIKELEQREKEKQISGIITVEEGGILNGETGRLESLYQAGVRLVTLTWNYENCIGYPNSRDSESMRKGLKPFGIQTVRAMNARGMVVDVSHLSDGGFWDCLRESTAPVAATHSNARSLCPHPRNLSDEMLRALGEKGGVVGLNFYSAFLREKGRADIQDIVRHGLHILECAGEDTVALGTDFDGFDREDLPGGIRGIQDMEKIWEAFKRAGVKERQLDKIWYKNVGRILHDVWK